MTTSTDVDQHASEQYQTHCAELKTWITRGPGVDTEALRRINVLLGEILSQPWYNTYVHEKAGSVNTYFKMWFSARKWNKRNDGGTWVHQILMQEIFKLEGACDTAAEAYRQRHTTEPGT